MAEQRAKSRQASKFSADGQVRLDLEGATEFLGYTHLESGAQVLALVREGQQVEYLEAGQQGIVILNQTPFYAESGGQQGDSGQLTSGLGPFSWRPHKSSAVILRTRDGYRWVTWQWAIP